MTITQELEVEGKWTKGPWRIVPYGDGDSLVIHDARDHWRICFMATPGESPGAMQEIEANATLIAAAPDLLEALKELTDNIERAWPSLSHLGPLVKARSAIARATGGEHG